MMGVSVVASFYGRGLLQKGVMVDLEQLETAAVLHDIGKAFDDTLWGHVGAGTNFLRDQGVDEGIMHLVEMHQIWQNEVTRPLTWEERLIVMGDLSFSDRIMPIGERVEDIVSRYRGKGISPSQEKWIRKVAKEICQDLSAIMPLSF